MQNTPAQKNRILWLDALKGLTIICVVTGHVADGYLVGNTFPECQNSIQCIFNIIYSFHMPLFFILSGYFFSLAYQDNNMSPRTDKLKLQIPNLIVIYFLFSVMLITFRVVFSAFSNHSASFAAIIDLWHSPNSLYWYLYSLILMYTICAIAGKYCTNKFFLLGSFVMSVISSVVMPSDMFTFQKTTYHLFFFLLGINIQRATIKITRPIAAILGAISVTTYVLTTYGGAKNSPLRPTKANNSNRFQPSPVAHF